MQEVSTRNGEIVERRRLTPAELSAVDGSPDGQVEVHLITYWSEGLRVKAYYIIPLGEDGKPLVCPGLVYCRGGIRKVGMVRLPRMITLARRGYAVLAPVYRGNLGGDGYEDFGGEDRFDLIHALRLMRSLPEVDPSPLSLIGFSRGAIMALCAAAECREQLGAVAVWGGVSDLTLTYEERVDLRRMLRRVVGHPKKQPEQYERRSPRLWAQHIDSPVLIIHGSEDEQVSVKHAYLLADSLEKAGKVYAMQIYDGLGHVFPKETDDDALDAIFNWFAKHRGAETRRTEGELQQ